MSRKTDGTGGGKADGGNFAVGYVRVSTKGQGISGISLDAQKVAIERFAEAAGYELIECFEDTASGVGEKSFKRREGLNAALDLATREKAVLIVWDWDRLSRCRDFEEQLRRFCVNETRIVCAKEGTKLRDASQASTFAHGEHKAREISRTTKEGMAKKRAEGAVFGNPQITTKVQPLGAASYGQAAQDLARRIADVLRMLDDPFGVSYSQVADLLNEKQIRTLQNRDWNKDRARTPVTKARELLKKEEEDALRSHPNFGMF